MAEQRKPKISAIKYSETIAGFYGRQLFMSYRLGQYLCNQFLGPNEQWPDLFYALTDKKAIEIFCDGVEFTNDP